MTLLLLAAARIGFQSGRLDARDGDDFVVIAGIAGNADRADDGIVAVANEYARRIGHKTPAARHPNRCKEGWILRRAFHAGARTPAKAERAVSLSDRNLVAENSRAVLALGADNVPAGIEHHDRLRHLLLVTRGLQADVDDGRSLSKRNGHFSNPLCFTISCVAPNRLTCASRRRHRHRFWSLPRTSPAPPWSPACRYLSPRRSRPSCADPSRHWRC